MPTETIRGCVTKVLYESKGFLVGLLETPQGDHVKFSGKGLTTRVGDAVVLHGQDSPNHTRGPQFVVERLQADSEMGQADDPASVAVLTSYIRHSGITGLGNAKSRRIAEAFGADLGRALQETPEKVAKVASVSIETIKSLHEKWLADRGTRNVLLQLIDLGIPDNLAREIVNTSGLSIIDKIRESPFDVSAISSLGFVALDDIATKLGMQPDNPRRIGAAALEAISDAVDDKGHTCMSYDVCVAAVAEKTGQPVTTVISTLGCYEKIVVDADFVATAEAYATEQELLLDLQALGMKPNPYFDEIAPTYNPELTEGQNKALQMALQYSACLISGPAGSGKTTLIKSLVARYKENGKNVVLTAFTGKAAKRMEDVVGQHASTIHRLLRIGNKKVPFGSKFPDPLEGVHVVIVDEVSMVPSWLLRRLVQALRPYTCLVLVGDHNQLPPIEPGDPLGALIKHQAIPTVVLDQVVRQAGALKDNSTAILQGIVRRTVQPTAGSQPIWVVNSDFRSAEELLAYLESLYATHLKRLGFDVLSEVQLITPTRRKGLLCANAINKMLQRVIQKTFWGVTVEPSEVKPKLLLNDRVIQEVNNYDLGVMNGTIGTVVEVSPVLPEIKVLFGDETVTYSRAEANSDLSLAYALSVHKFQGDQAPCIISLMHWVHYPMHTRPLLYTAATRAKKCALILGDNNIYTAAKTPGEPRDTVMSRLLTQT